MRFSVEATEMCIGANIEREDLIELPQGIQDCYNGICKYTKAEKVDALLDCDYGSGEVQLHITVDNGIAGDVTVGFFEGEDFTLTDKERADIKNCLMRLAMNSVQETA